VIASLALVFISIPAYLSTVGTQTLFFDDIYDQDAPLSALLASRRERLQAPRS